MNLIQQLKQQRNKFSKKRTMVQLKNKGNKKRLLKSFLGDSWKKHKERQIEKHKRPRTVNKTKYKSSLPTQNRNKKRNDLNHVSAKLEIGCLVHVNKIENVQKSLQTEHVYFQMPLVEV